jgi:alcohol dehydrogenase
MKALVYRGPGKRSWEEHRKPVLDAPDDAIVRMTATTICGTDLHILKGDVPEVTEGRILGHEGVGIVDEVGPAVTTLKKGDRVVVSCITSCGKCDFCRRGSYSHCRSGGWILGHLIDGTQAEYVRIPHAETSLYPAPASVKDEELTMLSDILPTGFEAGVRFGQVQPGATVAIVGAGPIGLSVLMTSQLYSPSAIFQIDPDHNRLEMAKSLGATEVIDGKGDAAVKRVMELTNGAGVDVAIEAVGVPETFEVCTKIVAPVGHVANIGVHGKPATLHLETLWAHNLTLTTRLVDTETLPMLLKMVVAGRLQPKKLITHRFKLAEAMAAYDVFGNAARERAIKVMLAG